MREEFIHTILQLARCPHNQSRSNAFCCNCKYRFLRDEECIEQLETEITLAISELFDYLENAKPKKIPTMEQKTASIFKTLGIPTHILGYKYLKYAVEAVYGNPNMLKAMTKSLYPEIASHFHSSSSKVERAIRHAIEVAWDRGDLNVQSLVFGYSISAAKGKPTNSEFIGGIVEYLRLEDLNDACIAKH